SIATIALVVLVGYFTQLLHQEDTAIKALQHIQDVRPLDKLNSVRKMVQLEGVLDKRDSQYDGYHHAVTDLRNLQDEMASAYQLANALANRAAWPFQRSVTSQARGGAEAGTQSVGSSGVAEAAPVVSPEATSGAPNEAQAQPPCNDGGAPHWLCGVLVDMAD